MPLLTSARLVIHSFRRGQQHRRAQQQLLTPRKTALK